MNADTITRSDIEAKLREIEGGVDEAGERAKVPVLVVATVAVVAVVGLAFVLGKRAGKKKTTVVEVRRL